MLINEVCKTTNLTKKAIDYYILQGLIFPTVLDNGYRDFTKTDVERLSKISVLRKLDISIDNIKKVLNDKTNSSLHQLTVKKELSVQREKAKKQVLDKLISGKNYCDISAELKYIEDTATITQKLLEAFPGYFGRFICLHYSRFLDEPVSTTAQEAVLQKIIDYLDNVTPIKLPQDLEDYLLKITDDITSQHINDLIESTKSCIEDPDKFLEENKDAIDEYIEMKQTEEYLASPANRLHSVLKDFCNNSGYYDIFIPLLKELSSSYDEYCKLMEIANEKILAHYPNIEKQ